MSFIHPVLMLGFFYFCFVQMQVGRRIASLKEKSPEYSDRGSIIEVHRRNAYILLSWVTLGLIGGVAMAMKVYQVPAPFFHTYGHGFFGVLALSLVLSTIFLGFNIKKITKPKIKVRFFTFHANMIYILGCFGLLSLLTGAVVLIRGISS